MSRTQDVNQQVKPALRTCLDNHRRIWFSPQVFFLAIAIPFGIMFAFVTPPDQAPDEFDHFCRAFELSEGRIIAIKRGNVTGDELPSSLITFDRNFFYLRGRAEEKTTRDAIIRCGAIMICPGSREFVAFSNTAIHSPLTYLPQALGIWLARQFSSTVLAGFYAGRVFNLAAYICLTSFAIRRAPIAKWVFVTMALTPMALFLAGSLSSDVCTNGISFLFLSQVLFCAFAPTEAFRDKRISWLTLLQVAVLGGAVGLCKQAYFFLPMTYLLISKERMGTRSRYWTGFVLVMGLTFLCVACWAMVVGTIYSPSNPKHSVEPGARLILILTNPLDFAGLLIRTVFEYGMVLLSQYLGVLGHLDTHLPPWILVLQGVVIAFAIFGVSDARVGLNWRQLILALGVSLLLVVTIFTVIRLTWNRVDEKIIFAQGRYFIPIGPLIGICGTHPSVSRLLGRVGQVIFKRTILAAVPCLLVGVVCVLFNRYYVDSPSIAARRAFQRANAVLAGDEMPPEVGSTRNHVASQQERLEFAVKNLTTATELMPNVYEYRQGFGVLLAKLCLFEEAHQQFRAGAAVAVKPNDAPAHYNLGMVLAELGRNNEAALEFKWALRLDPNLVKARENLQRIQNGGANK